MAYTWKFNECSQSVRHLVTEVKGENKIDDAVVLAKKEYAQQIATASGMDYIMVPGKQAKERLAL